MSADDAAPGQGPLIFLVAGEPSGDQLGGRLMAALKEETGGRVRFAGVGGTQMAAQGLDSLFPIDDLAVMGIFEILPVVYKVYQRVRRAAAAATALRPDAVVTIDAPSFTLEVSERLAGQGIPLIHYVAPSVWAWKPWRAKQMARYLDRLLALLPFEPPYFERHGLATTVVGHPAVEAANLTPDLEAFRARHAIPKDATLLCLLPGSRRGEVRRMEPVMAAALAMLAPRVEKLHALVPTVSTVAEEVTARAKAWPVPATILTDPADKYPAFALARAAMATSGTVAVELAIAEVPCVILYRVGPLSGVVAKLLLKIKYASLINILLDRAVQPELIQQNCTAERAAGILGDLLTDEGARAEQRAACREATALLGRGGERPSLKAARAVLSMLQPNRSA